MKSRRLLLVGCIGLVAVSVALCCGLGNFGGWRSMPVTDPSRVVDFTAESSSWDFYPLGHPTGVSVWVTGEITGEAEVWADGWEPHRLGGRVDWRVYHDWFYERCPLHYKPIGPVSGHLTIRYQFH